jgi:hypothetical protein
VTIPFIPTHLESHDLNGGTTVPGLDSNSATPGLIVAALDFPTERDCLFSLFASTDSSLSMLSLWAEASALFWLLLPLISKGVLCLPGHVLRGWFVPSLFRIYTLTCVAVATSSAVPARRLAASRAPKRRNRPSPDVRATR